MRIDRTHQPWIIATLIVFGIGAVGYIVYAQVSAAGPRGGSATGLAYGIAGYVLMLFAGVLGVRKRVRTWRVGRAQTWMRGHLWLGLLSLPLILFHAGFAWRGPLTFLLMVLLFIVIASGVFGAVLQHYLPSEIIREVPTETIYDEIPHVREQLQAEAERLVSSTRGLLGQVQEQEMLRFDNTYVKTIRPFLEAPEGADLELATAKRSSEIFQSLLRGFPAPLHQTIADLENICD